MQIKRYTGVLTAGVLAIAGAFAVTEGAQANDAAGEGTQTITLTDSRGNLTPVAEEVLAEEPQLEPAHPELTQPESAQPEGSRPADQPATNSTPNTESTGPASAETGVGSSTEAPAEPVIAEAAAVGENYLYLSEPLEVPTFGVAGITWDRGESLPAGASIDVRTRDGQGEWSAWYALDVEEAETGRPGTETNVSGNSTGIQIRITGSGELPAGLTVAMVNGEGSQEEIEPDLSDDKPAEGTLTDPVVNEDSADSSVALSSAFVDGGEAAGTDASARSATASTTGTTAENDAASLLASAQARVTARGLSTRTGSVKTALTGGQAVRANTVANIHTRAQWGADEKLMEWTPEYVTLEGAIIHHTAGSNDYTQAQVPALIRGIYSYHSQTREWGDIGYNVLIDKFGGRWEGRKGTLISPSGKMAVGAHAAPRNSGTLGVSVMGTFMNGVKPSATVISSLSDVIAARFAIAGVNPGTTNPLTVPSSTATGLRVGSAMPRIAGHKDVKATSCPGLIYDEFPVIRAQVAQKYAQLTAPVIDDSASTPSSQPTAEPTAPVADGTPVASTYYLSNAWGGIAPIQFVFGTSTDRAFVGDWDGDGKDTVLLRRGHGMVVNNLTIPTAEPSVTFYYGRPDDEMFVGDWDGDGKDTPTVRRGNMFYLTNVMGRQEAETVFAYGKPGDVILVGDWDGDGKDSFVVRRGNEYHIRNSLTSGVAESVVAYGKVDDAVYSGHFYSPRRDSLAVRRGKMIYISNTIHAGEADRVLSYGYETDEILVGDWDGNRIETFGVRR